MNEMELEKAMAEFLDDDQCETASEAVYQLIRTAFAAGWKAAHQARAVDGAGREPAHAP